MLQTGSCNTAVEESQMSRVMWYLWPATEGAAAFFLILGQGENPPREREGRTKVLGPLGCSGYYAKFPTSSGRSSDSQYTCCRRYIVSRRRYTRNENSNDTSPNRKLYHTCVMEIKYEYSVQQYQVYAMLVRGR